MKKINKRIDAHILDEDDNPLGLVRLEHRFMEEPSGEYVSAFLWRVSHLTFSAETGEFKYTVGSSQMFPDTIGGEAEARYCWETRAKSNEPDKRISPLHYWPNRLLKTKSK